jgi:hypothetical protein
MYNLNLELELTPRCYRGSPCIVVGFNNVEIYSGYLDSTRTFTFQGVFPKSSTRLWIELLNKHDDDNDLATGQDKAVIIDRITLNDITSENFIWQGLYRPVYPQAWEKNPPSDKSMDDVLKYHNYLGWNGKWWLDITIPVFTWIHKVEDLGWIYD